VALPSERRPCWTAAIQLFKEALFPAFKCPALRLRLDSPRPAMLCSRVLRGLCESLVGVRANQLNLPRLHLPIPSLRLHFFALFLYCVASFFYFENLAWRARFMSPKWQWAQNGAVGTVLASVAQGRVGEIQRQTEERDTIAQSYRRLGPSDVPLYSHLRLHHYSQTLSLCFLSLSLSPEQIPFLSSPP